MNAPPATARPPHRPGTVYIGRVRGIPIYLHFTFLVLLGYVVLARVSWGEQVLGGPVFMVAIFACVVLHELGHAMAARLFGIKTDDIVLYPIGGVARLRSMGEGWQEFWIALAGPAVNAVIVLTLFVALSLTAYPWLTLETIHQSPPGSPPPVMPFWQSVLTINLALLIFNMIPAFPMDGGRVLRSLLANLTTKARATAIAARVGQTFAILFMIAGLFGNPFLLLIGLFIFFSAGQEAAATTSATLMSGHSVRDAMITHFDVLQHGDTLARAAELLLATNQHDFPVMGGGEVIGLLERRALINGLAALGRDHYVAEAMTREFPRLAPGDGLLKAIETIQNAGGLPALVFEGDRFVGYVNQENLAEYLMIAQTRMVRR